MADEVEIVDDLFWASYAANAIKETIPTLNTAAERVSTLIGVFWPLYIAAVGLAGSFNYHNYNFDWYLVALFVLPIPLLVLAYFISAYAALPVLEVDDTDPNKPAKVIKLYKTTFRTKKCRLKLAIGIAWLATILIAFALALAYWLPKSEEPKENTVKITYDPEDKMANVGINGALPDDAVYTITFSNLETKDSVLFKGTAASGRGLHAVANISSPSPFTITVRWKAEEDAKEVSSFSRTITPEDTVSSEENEVPAKQTKEVKKQNAN